MASRRHAPSSEPGTRDRPARPATVDLHCHTTRSDGLLEPADLVGAAVAAGVRTLAISDHDSLAAYRELTGRGAPRLPDGLELLPAVEINAVGGGLGLEVHVLGYGVDPGSEAFEATLAEQRSRRRERFDRLRARLRTLELAVDEQLDALDLSRDDALGRPTVARALIAAGYATSVDDAFDRLLAHGRPAYVPREGIGPREAIGAIVAAGGLASLAHDPDAAAHLDRLRELRDAGLRGLEVFHRSFDEPTRTSVGAVASALGLVRTGGTDYHGDVGSYDESLAELTIDPAVADDLRAALGVPSSGP
jgi:predicted metal-dependent phosphoesterase TrpH